MRENQTFVLLFFFSLALKVPQIIAFFSAKHLTRTIRTPIGDQVLKLRLTTTSLIFVLKPLFKSISLPLSITREQVNWRRNSGVVHATFLCTNMDYSNSKNKKLCAQHIRHKQRGTPPWVFVIMKHIESILPLAE